ncbi:oxysterol-binding protein-related protein 8 [Microdochium nivale]|nr:oxysterol-binding protein-related protein 8 [Microdochium nivale]
MHGSHKITASLGRRRKHSNASSTRSSVDGSVAGDIDDDTTAVDAEQGNVLTHIISQLRPGADLSRVVLPTFILEPRSMLERITNFMCHPEMLLPIPEFDDPVDRFVSVVKFYLSGWHIRPPGVKKPLNPILGEVHTCYWDLPDGTKAYYISEQTSHHPPKSSYFYMAPDHHIRIDGTLKPRSKFLGNSAASMMEGIAVLSLTNRGRDPKKGEQYWLTQPNMYARGILFGQMKYELGDVSVVKCPELGLSAEIEFKTKGWVSGTYNSIGGTIRNDETGEALFELSGLWSEEMYVKDLRTGHREMFFDATRSRPSKPRIRPVEEQEENESVRLWQKTAQAVLDKNHEVATDEKTKIEEAQRHEAARRHAEGPGAEWHPRLFRRVRDAPGEDEVELSDLEWILDSEIDHQAPPDQLVEHITSVYPILKGQTLENTRQAATTTTAMIQQPVLNNEVNVLNSSNNNNHYTGQNNGNLIDFGESASTPPPPPPPIANTTPTPAIATATAPIPAPAPMPASATTITTTQAPTAAGPEPSHSGGEPASQDDISAMLRTTGKEASQGPLIDFAVDLKKNLPATTTVNGNDKVNTSNSEDKNKPTIRRSETEDTDDAFFDAES